MTYDELLDMVSVYVPLDAEGNVNHEFWGPSPDVRARNFKDPVRHVVRILEQKGEPGRSGLVAAWREYREAEKVRLNAEKPQHTRAGTFRAPEHDPEPDGSEPDEE
jgi:hypothetical protein